MIMDGIKRFMQIIDWNKSQSSHHATIQSEIFVGVESAQKLVDTQTMTQILHQMEKTTVNFSLRKVFLD
jgi:hypothetical protein